MCYHDMVQMISDTGVVQDSWGSVFTVHSLPSMDKFCPMVGVCDPFTTSVHEYICIKIYIDVYMNIHHCNVFNV